MTGARLAEMTKNFRDFTEKLKISGETAENLKRTFKGVFAIFSIAKQIISGVVGVFFDLIGALGSGTGGILKVTGGIGEFVSGIDAALKKGDGLKNFFAKLGEIVAIPVKGIQELIGAFASLFTGSSSAFLDNLTVNFAAAGPFIDGFRAKIQDIVEFIKNLVSDLVEMQLLME